MPSATGGPVRENRETISELAHALKNPLQTIVGTADLLTLGRFGTLDHEQSRALARIESAAAELERGIEAIVALLLQRLDPSSEPEPFPLTPLLDSVLDRQQRESRRTGVRILRDVPDDLPPIRARRTVVQRVVDALGRHLLTGARLLRVRARVGRAERGAFVRLELIREGAPGSADPGAELLPLFRVVIAAEGGELETEPGNAAMNRIAIELPSTEETE